MVIVGDGFARDGETETGRRSHTSEQQDQPDQPELSRPPAPLASALQELSGLAHAGILVWGPARQVFCNAQGRSLLGIPGTTSAAIAQAIDTAKANSWIASHPNLDIIFETGQGVLRDRTLQMIERHGRPEECYWVEVYRPLLEPSGRVGGVLYSALETTATVVGDRRWQILAALNEAAARVTTLSQAAQIIEVLATQTAEFPFALLYWVDQPQQTAILAQAVGLDFDTVLAPALLPLDKGDRWGIGRVVETAQPQWVDNLADAQTWLPQSSWGVPPQQAYAQPLRRPGDRAIVAVLVLGLSPHRPWDEEYCQFTALITTQVEHGLAQLSPQETSFFAPHSPIDSADREQLLAALAQERARFEAVLRQMPAGVIIADAASGTLTLANHQASEIIGHAYQDQRPLTEYRHIPTFGGYYPDGKPYAPEDWPLARALNHGETVKGEEIEIRHSDGSRLWIEATAAPIQTAQGDIMAAVVIFQDVSDRKATEAALRDSEARFRRMADSIPDVFWLLDTESHQYLYINRSYETLWGRSCQSLYDDAHSWTAAIHPDDRDRVWSAFESGLTSGQYSAEYRVVRPDGDVRWVKDSSFQIACPSTGAPQISGITEDITERKLAEMALQASEERFRLAARAATGLVYDWSLHDGHVYRSDGLYELIGLHPHEVPETREWWADQIHPEDLARLTPEIEAAMAEGGDRYSFEYRVRHTDGHWITVWDQGYLMRDDQGNIMRVVGSSTDISDRKQAEERLRDTEERLRLALTSAQMVAWDTNLHTQEVVCSDNATELLGFVRGSSEAFLALIYPDDRDELIRTIEQALAGCKDYCVEYRILNSRGQTRWIRSQGRVYCDVQGRPMRLAGVSLDISEHRHAETALRESEARFRRIFECNMVPMGVWDNTGTIVEANRAFLELLGYDRADLEARRLNWRQLTPPEYSDRDRQAAQEIAVHGVCEPFEKAYLHRSGTQIPLLMGGGAFEDDPASGIFFAVDLTILRKTEAALRHSQQQFQIAQELSLDAFTVLRSVRDASGAIADFEWVYANPKAGELLGRSPENLVGQRLLTILPGNKAPGGIFDQYVQVIETGQAQDSEIFYDADGITGWFRNMTVKLEDGVAVSFSNITSRKEAEQERERLLGQLREANALLDTVLNNAPVGIGVWDEQLRFVRLNEALAQINGISHASHLGKSVQELLPKLSPKVTNDFLQVIRTQEALIGQEICGETPAVPGKQRTWSVNYYPIDRANGTTWVGAICEEITERKQAEAEREQLLARAEAARAEAEATNRIKDEFLAILSHELRSPLNPILGWSRLLQVRQFDHQTTAQALETIERNAKLQVQLIDDLLDVSRILRGKLSLAMAAVNLATTVTAALETVKLAAEARSIEIQTELSNLRVLGDGGRLQQVVWNLVSNAIKFTPRGGKVALVLHQTGREAELRVTDNGKGIKPEFLAHVFDYFRQEDSRTTRRFGGLGLGLAIVRHLVEMHGGTVSAESLGEGQGATFTVRLPLLEREGDRPLCETPLSPGISSEQPLTGLKILLVEDEPDTRDFMVFLLEQAGARVTAAASATLALERLSRTTIDILVSDIGMPGMDGYELIRQVRSRSASEQGTLKAIALTAYASRRDADKALAAGFQRHLSKPIDIETLIQTILELV